MSKGSSYTPQNWRTDAEFPAELIKQQWGRGYKITSVSYGQSRWAVVMSKGSSLTAQTWQTRSRFPLAFVQEKWSEGKLITSLAFGGNRWALVMSKGSGFEAQRVSVSADRWYDSEQTY